MARNFTDIAFTEAVRAFQARMGSRHQYAALDDAPAHDAALGDPEAAFIAERDGFYQASVGETGWPYVQFRGGPAGFLKVIDARTIGYADFRGNVQYISAGNLEANDRVSLILMDYARRRRLKIWGRARLVDVRDDEALVERLEMPSYRARVERAVLIAVEAFDWNCPQHITPRFTAAEFASASTGTQAGPAGPATGADRPRAAAPASGASTSGASASAAWGRGPLSLVVAGVRQLTPRVRAYTLQAAAGGQLPAVAAGAHLDLPVHLPDGRSTTRRYSIASNPAQTEAWELAVQADASGSGGSAAVHAAYGLGLRLNVDVPGNDFALHDDARPAVLLAAGIGITPLRAMAHALRSSDRDFSLHCAARSRAELPWADELARDFAPRTVLYAADAGHRLDLEAVMRTAPSNALFYVCGPGRFIEAAQAIARQHGLHDSLRTERFTPRHEAADTAITVTLARSGRQVEVGPGTTVLEAVSALGIAVPAACRAGTCGTCATKVLDGMPDHRDTALSPLERDQAGLMCLCVSRARTPQLVLDL